MSLRLFVCWLLDVTCCFQKRSAVSSSSSDRRRSFQVFFFNRETTLLVKYQCVRSKDSSPASSLSLSPFLSLYSIFLLSLSLSLTHSLPLLLSFFLPLPHSLSLSSLSLFSLSPSSLSLSLFLFSLLSSLFSLSLSLLSPLSLSLSSLSLLTFTPTLSLSSTTTRWPVTAPAGPRMCSISKPSGKASGSHHLTFIAITRRTSTRFFVVGQDKSTAKNPDPGTVIDSPVVNRSACGDLSLPFYLCIFWSGR